MNRRDFFKTSFIALSTIGFSFLTKNKLYSLEEKKIPDLVTISGGEADVMFDKGIEAIGGITQFVKKGQTVVIKPNIGWNRSPEYGATTNPKLVKRIVEHCYQAGAKKVYVFDNTCNEWKSSYKNSGIQNAVEEAGGIMVPANSEGYYQTVEIKKAQILENVKVHELFLSSDVIINVPVLKHHSSTILTIAMKNLMGAIWDRQFYHANGLHQCIAEFCLFKKPHLNIVDAYTVMKKNGPRGRDLDDVVIMKQQLISTDIVAIDAFAAKIFGLNPNQVPYIKIAHNKKIGNMNIEELTIKKIVL